MKLKELLAPMDENSKVAFSGDRWHELSKTEAIEKYGDFEVKSFFPDSYRLLIAIRKTGRKDLK